ncbi:MAG: hypothetical protein C0483_20280 [Pirellula sp.]|nr:hypothetical protein [Pirellula sp.]
MVFGIWSLNQAFAWARYIEMRPRVLEWRKEYAYKSLSGRLAYERPLQDAPAPKLSKASLEVLAKDDEQDKYHWNPRAESLKLLHSESVAQFVSRNDRFGYSRMPAIGPSYIEQRRPYEDLTLARAAALPREEYDAAPVQASADGATSSPEREVEPGTPIAVVEALSLHRASREAFLSPSQFGYIENVDRVAGFASHGFNWRPEQNANIPDTWKTVRLELLSWLKHDEPRVYVSEKLPRMEELSSTKTRDLDRFETSALEQLKGGEELQTASTPNRIVMLGALRASNSCLQCHSVPHGTLLGAFSYELHRDPPLAISQPAVVQQ